VGNKGPDQRNFLGKKKGERTGVVEEKCFYMGKKKGCLLKSKKKKLYISVKIKTKLGGKKGGHQILFRRGGRGVNPNS